MCCLQTTIHIYRLHNLSIIYKVLFKAYILNLLTYLVRNENNVSLCVMRCCTKPGLLRSIHFYYQLNKILDI